MGLDKELRHSEQHASLRTQMTLCTSQKPINSKTDHYGIFQYLKVGSAHSVETVSF